MEDSVVTPGAAALGPVADTTQGARALTVAGTVLLSLLGVAGNYFSLPLFFGIDLVFGSLATFMAIRLYGGVAGVLVAIPGALYTIVLWGHPYTAPVLILEAVTVALLATRLRYIALADGLFWLVLGGPVLMILFWLFLGQPGYVSQLVVFKQFVNGILNASLASMIVIGIDVLVRRRQVSFSQLLFNMLVLAILVPGVVLVSIDTRLSRVDLERSVAEKLNAAASFALSTLAGADDSADAARLQVALERLPLETGIGVQYQDRDGRAVAGTSSAALPVGGSVMTISPGLEIWLPDREGASILAWWKRARYVVAREFGVPEPGGRVLMHYDASLVIQRLESRNLKAFVILAILTALTILVALGGTGVLSRPLLRLGLASVKMAEDVESKKAIQLPRGAIRETNQLAGQLSEMGNALVRSYTALELRNRFIRETFGRYLSDDVVNNLLDAPEGLRLGGEKREVTILMSDLRGFTSMSEVYGAEQVVTLLNNYLGAMTDIILHYGGTIDEFIGDAILVLFGAPQQREDDAARAVACALAMQQEMAKVNAWNAAQGLPAVEMGIGLNTGSVIVGNIGSQRRTKYAAVGSHVNLTGRIESFTVGGQVLISGSTRRAVGTELQVESETVVEPKGVKEPITLYEIGGIGAPFSIRLERDAEPMRLLAAPLPLGFSLLEGKQALQERSPGTIVALSSREAELRTETPVPPMSNILLRLESHPEAHIHAKVLARRAEAGDVQILRFTSLPAAVAAHLDTLPRIP